MLDEEIKNFTDKQKLSTIKPALHENYKMKSSSVRKTYNKWKKSSTHIASACALSLFSHARLFVIPRNIAHQAPMSMGFLQTRILEWVAMASSRGSS